MKTRYFILATLAMAGLAVSCAKSQIGGETPLPEEEAPVPIQLTTNLKVNDVALTKAGVDAWAAEQKLYIYALPTNEIPAEGSTDILVNNAMASAPTEGGTGTTRYEKKDITLNKAEGTFYYYPADKTTLDFYGYYVGDAFVADPNQEGAPTKPNPTITSDTNISLHLYLDGSQDIMLAKADKEEDVLEASELISPANAYSAYSARKDVKPNLKFEHQLSRFVFNVVAGNSEGKKVKIKAVTLTSNNKADLVIAAKNDGQRGIKSPSGEGTFKLKDKEGHEVSSWFPQNIVSNVQYTFGENDRVGESIMVIPNNEPTEIKDRKHKLVILMRQMSAAQDGTEIDEDFSYVYDLTPDMVVPAGDKFLPGYQYNVNVVVYGREEVKVSVQLTEWAAGGSITIDNDKEWGDEPKLGYKATNSTTQEVCYLYFYDNPILAAEGENPGTEVKYWDKNANEMAAPATGIYMFVGEVTNGDTPLYGVELTSNTEGNKTTVSRLILEAPNPETPSN